MMRKIYHLSLLGLLCSVFLSTADAQLRRPSFVTIKHEDRNESNLIKEKGAVYLEGLVTQEVKVKVTQAAPTYANVSGQRWLGNIFANQSATLLAVSDRAYRIRGRAKQGQIAGWVGKAFVEGLPDGFEDKLVKYHQRYEMVKQLIDNQQVALGMTTDEVIASIGPPDTKSSRLDTTGRVDIFEFISYERQPQPVVNFDAFGRPYTSTRYVEVESGRVTIEFTDNLVSAISETAGLGFNKGAPATPLPIFVPLF